MQHCDAFDYWGKGTEVTVSSATAAAPTLFPLVECESKTPDKITVGCLAQDFYPKSLTFQWIAASGTILTPTQYPPTERNNKYTGVSLVEVSKSDWKSRKSFTCTVTYQGGTKRVILETKAPSPTTVAALIITAQKPPRDKDTIIQSNSKSDVTEPKVSVHVLPEEDIRTQKPPRAKDDLSDHDVTEPKVTVHVLPDGNEPKVSVHVLPEEDVRTADSVTLVCLVSSREKQDYKIAWIEYSGQNVSNYKDGIDFPPQMTNQGFSATSIYNTTKEKWNNDDMFSCNVWLAGSGREPTKSRNVSNAQNNMNESLNLQLAMSCTDGAIEEDEYSSLWSTTLSFIFLFISSLLYSMIFSLVKMKKP